MIFQVNSVVDVILQDINYLTNISDLIPDVPLCFLSFGTEFCCESDFLYGALFNLSINRLFNPFHFFLKYVTVAFNNFKDFVTKKETNKTKNELFNILTDPQSCFGSSFKQNSPKTF